MANAVFCIVHTLGLATTIVAELKEAGFSDNDVSILLPDKHGTHHFVHEQHTKAPEGAIAGGGVGAAFGGVLGLLAGMGTLAIPGLDGLAACGPMFAALSAAAVGAALGAAAGALTGMNIPEFEAKLYSGRIEGGNVLMSVHANTPRKLSEARQIFEQGGGQDIATATERPPPAAGDKLEARHMSVQEPPYM